MNWLGLNRFRWVARQSNAEALVSDAAPAEVVELPHRYQGYIDELSATHAAGWVRSLSDAGERVEYEGALPRTGEILVSGRVDRFLPGLIKIGDGVHGFHARLPWQLNADELSDAQVRT